MFRSNSFSLKNSASHKTKQYLFGKNELSIVSIAFLALFLIATNLSSLVSVYIYSIACFLYIAFFDFKRGIFAVFLNIVYLGYSYIEFPANFIFGTSELITLCVVLLVARWLVFRFIINSHSEKAIRLNYFTIVALIVALYFSLSRYQISLFSIASMFFSIFCAIIFSNELDSKEYASNIATALFVILSTVVLYYFVWTRNIFSIHDYWIGNRFTGVRDPNNFALFANYTIVLFCIAKDRISKSYRFLAVALLSIGVIATISLSGIFSLLAIYVFILISKKKVKSILILLSICIIAFAFYKIIGSLNVSQSTTLGAIIIRFQNLFQSLSKGDYYSATTTRFGIWEQYLGIFNSLSSKEKVFGNISLIDKRLIDGEMASHNTFIDVLISYGIVGLSLFLLLIIVFFIKSIANKKYWQAVLCLIFVTNLFFRTILSTFLWIGILS